MAAESTMGDMTHRGWVIVALAYCLVLMKASYANVQISGNNCNLSQNGYGAERDARAFLAAILDFYPPNIVQPICAMFCGVLELKICSTT